MHILATSGGFVGNNRYGLSVGPVLRHALEIAGNTTDPKVCLLNTAMGDHPNSFVAGYSAFARDVPGARVSHLALFPMPNIDNVREHLLSQDVIHVGGGSVANLLAVWRAHDLDTIFRECWESGVVLTGVSAGSLCWHVGGTTDSFGPDLRPVTNGLALLQHSNCVHYNSEAQRRPLYQSLVQDGTLPDGWASDDGVGLHFEGQEFVEAVTDRDNAFAYRVERTASGEVVETKIEPRRLNA